MPQSAGTTANSPLPKHIAIVMDGNGRWATEKGKLRPLGHKAGGEAIRRIVPVAVDRGVKYLTLYAFSSENWSRPRTEITALFKLLNSFLKKYTSDLVEKGVRLETIGRIDSLPKSSQDVIAKAKEDTSRGEAMTLTLALSYGAMDELVDATREIAKQVKAGELNLEEIDRENIAKQLYAPEQPPVDLLIRTGGEFRVSNFLLWQIAYAELYFTDTFWPNFDAEHLDAALSEYASRNRRFGGTD